MIPPGGCGPKTWRRRAEGSAQVNIGAGTITCNYDDAGKRTAIIEDGAFTHRRAFRYAATDLDKGRAIGFRRNTSIAPCLEKSQR
jgi:hypothetical protein